MEVFVFSVQAFKEIKQKLFQICLTPWKNSQCHSTSYQCIKSLSIICSKAAKVTSKQYQEVSFVGWNFSKLKERSLEISFESFYSTNERFDDTKLFLKNSMSWIAGYNCSSSSKNNPDKTFFILPKNECTRKAWITVINWKEDTLPKNVYLC